MAAGAGAIKAGRAFVELFTEDSKLDRGLRSAERRIKAWGASVRSISSKIFAVGAGTATGLLAITKAAASGASSLTEMAARTGASVEALSELAYVASQSKTDIEELEKGMRGFQKVLGAAMRGSKDAKGELAELGLTVGMLAGLPADKQLELVADALMNVADPSMRAASALKVLGRTGTMVLPMLSQGSKGIQELRRQAQALGLTVKTADAEALDAFNDALTELGQVVSTTSQAIGVALAPAFRTITKAASTALAQINKFIDDHRELTVTVLLAAASIASLGAAGLALSFTLSGIGSVLGAVTSTVMLFGRVVGTVMIGAGKLVAALSMNVAKLGVAITQAIVRTAILAFVNLKAALLSVATSIAAMMTPIGVLGFALAGLGVYALYASGVVQNAMGAIGGFFRGVQADVQESFGAIVEAMTRGDIIAAANVLWATLQVIWQRGALALNQVWQPSVKFFLDVWNSAAGTAAAVFINVFATIETAFVSMVDAMKDAWSGLVIQFAQSMAGPLKEVGSFIAAITTKLKGGSDEDVISAIRGSRKGFDVAAAALAGGATEDVRARAEKRQKRLEEIEARRRGALGQNNAMVAAQFAGTDAAQAAALTKSEQALKDAQAQLAAARGVARNGSGRNGRLPNGQPAPSIPSVGNKFAAAGTFSAFSLSGLGGGRTELTNIATNTKQANKHLAQIASGVPFLPLVPLFAP